MKRFANLITVTVVLTTIFALLFAPGCAKKPQEPTEIKIGTILPLTGNVGIFGQWAKNGMDLALNNIEKNNETTKNKIKIIYEDSQNDAKLGITSLNKLLTVDKVDVVISAMSKVTIPLIPIVNEKKIPLLMQDVTYPEITKRSDMLFRHFIQSDREAFVIAKHAVELGIKTVGILYVNDEAGLGAKNSFAKTFSESQGKVLLAETYEVTDTDMKSQISKIIPSGADAIYLFGNGPSWAICLKQIKELGYKGTVFTNAAMYIPNFRKMAGDESVEGVYFTYPYMDETSPSVQEFIKLYREKYGDYPSMESAYAWDLIHIIAKASTSKNGTMYEKLLSVKSMEGAFGLTQIPEDRDVKTSIGIGVIKDNKIVRIKIEE